MQEMETEVQRVSEGEGNWLSHSLTDIRAGNEQVTRAVDEQRGSLLL